MTAQAAAEAAVGVVGCGYDLICDLHLGRAKLGGRLVDIDGARGERELLLAGGAVVPGVPMGIVADKGERTQFRSDVLSFAQMTEQVNQTLSVAGKIPSGAFNAMFDYHGSWHKDAAATKSLCFDGRFVELYTVEAPRAHLAPHDCIKRDIPPFWDPSTLAEFIDKYGTRVIVWVKMGGKDVVAVKQLKGSNLIESGVQARLKKLADDKLSQDPPESITAADDKLSQGLKNIVVSSPAVMLPGNFGLGSAAWRSFRPSVVSQKDVSKHGYYRWTSSASTSEEGALIMAKAIENGFRLSTAIGRHLDGLCANNFTAEWCSRLRVPEPCSESLPQIQPAHRVNPAVPEIPGARVWGAPPLGLPKKNLLSLQFTLMGPKLHVTTAKDGNTLRAKFLNYILMYKDNETKKNFPRIVQEYV